MKKVSRIGMIVLAIFLSTSVILTFFLIASSQRSLSAMTESILREEAGNFVNIMKGDISRMDSETRSLRDEISADSSVAGVLQSGDAGLAKEMLDTYVSEENMFGAFFNNDGVMFGSTEISPKICRLLPNTTVLIPTAKECTTAIRGRSPGQGLLSLDTTFMPIPALTRSAKKQADSSRFSGIM